MREFHSHILSWATWVLYPSKEKYNVMIKDLAYGAFTLVYPLVSEPIRKGNILQVCQPLVSYIRHQEGLKLATNFIRNWWVCLNDLTPAFPMLKGLVQRYLTAQL